ncbi:Protein of unknown function [Cotesia congregata]|uniref:Uncharacterized protein n=1 Tax=Cotesia congregata TaxID=51543 RepID=A0A8J2HPY0_COTCN|nr:Protein of unknown function [Cotesia congregata]
MKTSVRGINMRNKRPCVGLCLHRWMWAIGTDVHTKDFGIRESCTSPWCSLYKVCSVVAVGVTCSLWESNATPWDLQPVRWLYFILDRDIPRSQPTNHFQNSHEQPIITLIYTTNTLVLHALGRRNEEWVGQKNVKIHKSFDKITQVVHCS